MMSAWGWPLSWRWVSALLIYLSFLTGTGSAFNVGQTGFLICASVALLGYGMAERKVWIGALAMAGVLLKPQVGLVFFAALAVHPRYWRMALFGGLLTGVMALPGVIASGLVTTLREYLVNLGRYRDIPYNLPDAMTGMGSLAAAAGYSTSAIGMTVVASVVGAIVFRLNWRHAGQHDGLRDFHMFFLITLSCVACFVGMHIYDLVVVSALVLFAASLRPAPAGLAAVGLLLLLRPENLARAIGQPAVGAPLVAAMGGLCVLAATLAQAMAARAEAADRALPAPGTSG